MAQETKAGCFRFQPIPNKEWSFLNNNSVKESLMKWSMLGRLGMQAFCFDKHLSIYENEDFVKEFLSERAVLTTLKVLSQQGRWEPLGTPAAHVSIEVVPCTQTTLTMFDKLTESGIVRENGHIRKCMEEYVDDFVLADELRKLLAGIASDYEHVFSEPERAEFLYRLVAHLALGGRWCQYEDSVQPYLDTARLIYKELVSVCKCSDSTDLRVTSHVLKVVASSEGGADLVPRQPRHPQNFLYLLVDPLKRVVTTFYHQFGVMLDEV